jgi:hypothetical protein
MPSPEKSPAPAAALPPAPPGELPAEAVAHARAVSEALARLGDKADERALAEHVRSATGLDLPGEEIAAIRRELIEKRKKPEQRGE